MKRVLLTGMSGVGKTTVLERLAALGYKTVETDEMEWLTAVAPEAGDGDKQEGTAEDWEWVWNEERMHALLDTEDAEILFVSGCRSNQGKFYLRFDHVILLSAPADVVLERLTTRTNNPYGKRPEERARILKQIESIEPLLRRRATLEVITTAPTEAVVEAILTHVRA
jgi:dephospho-CoA kinase